MPAGRGDVYDPAAFLDLRRRAQDVARACLQVLQHDATANRVYEIAGGETLSYHEMVRRIFIAQQRNPRLPRLPVAGMRLALVCLQIFPGYRDLGAAVADRMNQDMVFDCSAAERDFGFRPRGFSGTL
jgi:uncharacterized protein YbjT (DUF2867 family)